MQIGRLNVIRFAADENFSGVIVRALKRRRPGLDIVRIQDTDIAGSDDPTLLAWAAQEQRIILTHDQSTIPNFVAERVKMNLPVSGVFVVPSGAPVKQVIVDIEDILDFSLEGEYENQVRYLPL
jgi:hypothetical protein